MSRARKDMTKEQKVRDNRIRTIKRRYSNLSPEKKEKYLAKRRYSILSPEKKFKANCRNKTRKAIKRGSLIKEPCIVCQTTEQIEAHHNNYMEWRDITWLCREHHLKYHQEIEKIKEAFKPDGLKIPYNFMPH